MRLNSKIWQYVLIAIIIIGLLIGVKYIVNKPQPSQTIEYITVRDTITTYKIDTFLLKIPVVKTKYLYDIDTIIITQAFEKYIDTTFADSTYLHVSYFYPGDTFKIKLQTAIREIYQRDSIKVYIPQIVTSPQNKTTPLITGVAGLVGGVILGVIIAK